MSFRLKMVVGTWGLEPQTSTVSILRSTTQNPLLVLLFRFQTTYLKTPPKQPIFGDELVTSFCNVSSGDVRRIASG